MTRITNCFKFNIIIISVFSTSSLPLFSLMRFQRCGKMQDVTEEGNGWKTNLSVKILKYSFLPNFPEYIESDNKQICNVFVHLMQLSMLNYASL